jgi:hypothetical protein
MRYVVFRVDVGCYGRRCFVIGYLKSVVLFSKFQLMGAIVVLLCFVPASFSLLMYVPCRSQPLCGSDMMMCILYVLTFCSMFWWSLVFEGYRTACCYGYSCQIPNNNVTPPITAKVYTEHHKTHATTEPNRKTQRKKKQSEDSYEPNLLAQQNLHPPKKCE